MAIVVTNENKTSNGPLIGNNSVCGGGTNSKRTSMNWTTKTKRKLTDYKLLLEAGSILPALGYKLEQGNFKQQGGFPTDGGSYYVAPLACGHGNNIAAIDVVDLNDTRNKALRNLHDRVRDGKSFNLGVALAEMPQTLRLVVSTVNRLSGAFDALRRGNVKQAFSKLGIWDSRILRGTGNLPFRTAGAHRRHLQSMANSARRMSLRRGAVGRNSMYNFASQSWLELQYGWKPLYNDVYGSAEAVGRGLQARSDDITISARSRRESTKSSISEDGTFKISKSGKHTFTCAYSVSLGVLNPVSRNLAALGLSNPALIIWEKVPFSFVVDWFVPIGSFLEDLDTFTGYTTINSCRSELHSESNSCVMITKDGSRGPGEYEGKVIKFERFTDVSLSPPSPFANLGKKLGMSKLTSAFALAKLIFLPQG